ncbi:hypothetical protein ENSA5_11430 [Enhygromyxa salina]|uniref:SMc04008-like domain-containing protein n=1 Tax=Enhygromyxa salina TaxID=215803 RepID=A0A2S9YG58_9BACT|nr:DUF1244 domain-containing protein [Enhygromyxa salina]PRQ04095.1 hypothetical protein ENSA5_11430 [Enhygromyxa salina]
MDLDDETRTKLEAAAFRRLVAHLQARTDVQNIDIMNLAGFCRNCLSKWYRAAAEEAGIELELDEVREEVYGMPYAEWKAKYQVGPKRAHGEPPAGEGR